MRKKAFPGLFYLMLAIIAVTITVAFFMSLIIGAVFFLMILWDEGGFILAMPGLVCILFVGLVIGLNAGELRDYWLSPKILDNCSECTLPIIEGQRCDCERYL